MIPSSSHMNAISLLIFCFTFTQINSKAVTFDNNLSLIKYGACICGLGESNDSEIGKEHLLYEYRTDLYSECNLAGTNNCYNHCKNESTLMVNKLCVHKKHLAEKIYNTFYNFCDSRNWQKIGKSVETRVCCHDYQYIDCSELPKETSFKDVQPTKNISPKKLDKNNETGNFNFSTNTLPTTNLDNYGHNFKKPEFTRINSKKPTLPMMITSKSLESENFQLVHKVHNKTSRSTDTSHNPIESTSNAHTGTLPNVKSSTVEYFTSEPSINEHEDMKKEHEHKYRTPFKSRYERAVERVYNPGKIDKKAKDIDENLSAEVTEETYFNFDPETMTDFKLFGHPTSNGKNSQPVSKQVNNATTMDHNIAKRNTTHKSNLDKNHKLNKENEETKDSFVTLKRNLDKATDNKTISSEKNAQSEQISGNPSFETTKNPFFRKTSVSETSGNFFTFQEVHDGRSLPMNTIHPTTESINNHDVKMSTYNVINNDNKHTTPKHNFSEHTKIKTLFPQDEINSKTLRTRYVRNTEKDFKSTLISNETIILDKNKPTEYSGEVGTGTKHTDVTNKISNQVTASIKNRMNDDTSINDKKIDKRSPTAQPYMELSHAETLPSTGFRNATENSYSEEHKNTVVSKSLPNVLVKDINKAVPSKDDVKTKNSTFQLPITESTVPTTVSETWLPKENKHTMVRKSLFELPTKNKTEITSSTDDVKNKMPTLEQLVTEDINSTSISGINRASSFQGNKHAMVPESIDDVKNKMPTVEQPVTKRILSKTVRSINGDSFLQENKDVIIPKSLPKLPTEDKTKTVPSVFDVKNISSLNQPSMETTLSTVFSSISENRHAIVAKSLSELPTNETTKTTPSIDNVQDNMTTLEQPVTENTLSTSVIDINGTSLKENKDVIVPKSLPNLPEKDTTKTVPLVDEVKNKMPTIDQPVTEKILSIVARDLNGTSPLQGSKDAVVPKSLPELAKNYSTKITPSIDDVKNKISTVEQPVTERILSTTVSDINVGSSHQENDNVTTSKALPEKEVSNTGILANNNESNNSINFRLSFAGSLYRVLSDIYDPASFIKSKKSSILNDDVKTKSVTQESNEEEPLFKSKNYNCSNKNDNNNS